RKQQLKHHVRTVKEFEFYGSEIEFPHPTEPFVVDRGRLGSVFGEALAPMFNRVMIMEPQHFHIVAPQAAALSGGERFRQRRYISARKDVFADERAGGARL